MGTEHERDGEGPSPGRTSGSAGRSRLVRAALIGASTVLALGLAWYVAEGYRAAGGEERGPAGGERRPVARAGSADRAAPAPRPRRRAGSRGWLDVPAPVVTFPTLAGDTASLAGLRGQAVVLNFWATWCPPCEREIPELVRLQDSLRHEPATVVGVAVSSGSRSEIRSFGEEHGIDYPVWLSDPATAATEYRAVGLPLTLLVDGRGRIRRRYMGPQTYETLREDVRTLLAGEAGPGAGPPGSGGAR